MRDCKDHYEYIAVMVDDILVFSKESESIIEPKYNSVADIAYDKSRQCWTMSAKTYIKTLCNKIEKLLDVHLKNYGSPREAGDHPETDETDILLMQTKFLFIKCSREVPNGQSHLEELT